MEGGDTKALAGRDYHALLSDVQQDLFVVQAELAGGGKHVTLARVTKIEEWVNAIEKELPPITSFFVSGGTKLGALCDVSRTIARRAERRVVSALESSPSPRGEERSREPVLTGAAPQDHLRFFLKNPNGVLPRYEEGWGEGIGSPPILAYMNRLSSLLYALARLANHRAGITEEKPHY
jgi:cob(I)alamin adenosyltransferase